MPSLPLDLERLIFEIAALQDIDHNSRVRLTLVAKRVYEWIQPILLRVVVILRDQCKIPGKLTDLNWRNAQVINTPQFVRHLLTNTNDESLLLEMISTFPNIENLAIWGDICISPEILQKMNDLPLRMLAVYLAGTSLEHYPTFNNLTHLEIMGWTGGGEMLIGLPNLTHLCFVAAVYMEGAVVLDLLTHCTSLRVLIFLMFAGAGYVDLPITLDDPRYLILLDGTNTMELIDEWERSANGLIGYWELAEIIVDARNANLFKDRSSFLFSRKTWMEHLNDDGMRWYNEWSRGLKNVA